MVRVVRVVRVRVRVRVVGGKGKGGKGNGNGNGNGEGTGEGRGRSKGKGKSQQSSLSFLDRLCSVVPSFFFFSFRLLLLSRALVRPFVGYTCCVYLSLVYGASLTTACSCFPVLFSLSVVSLFYLSAQSSPCKLSHGDRGEGGGGGWEVERGGVGRTTGAKRRMSFGSSKVPRNLKFPGHTVRGNESNVQMATVSASGPSRRSKQSKLHKVPPPEPQPQP